MNEQQNSTYSYVPDPKMAKRKGRGAGKIIAIALICAVLGGALGAGGFWYFSDRKGIEDIAPAEPVEENSTITRAIPGALDAAPEETVVPEAVTVGPETAASQENSGSLLRKGDKNEVYAPVTAVEVYEQNVGSTVGIQTSVVTTNYWGQPVSGAAAGSGFIVSEDGYILTCYHVVENANTITISCFDGTEYDANLVGYDAGNDIAILKVDAKDLVPVTIGNSSALKVGETVVAIGNPMGELTFSCTQGVISAMNRELTMENGATMTLLQTDCAINSGNSGGALFNMRGEVIGITNAKYGTSGSSASVDNLGFAIPMDQVINIVESIIEKGYISKPYIGVSVTTVSEDIQSYGYPAGAAVKEIVEGSPAEEAGLEYNDIITAIDGEAITSSNELVSYVGKCKPGEEIVLTVFRQGEDDLLEITMEVGEKQVAAIEEDTEEVDEVPEQRPSNGFGGYGGDDNGDSWSYTFPWGDFGFNFDFGDFGF